MAVDSGVKSTLSTHVGRTEGHSNDLAIVSCRQYCCCCPQYSADFRLCFRRNGVGPPVSLQPAHMRRHFLHVPFECRLFPRVANGRRFPHCSSQTWMSRTLAYGSEAPLCPGVAKAKASQWRPDHFHQSGYSYPSEVSFY